MSSALLIGLQLGLSALVILFVIIALFKSRYRTFTNREFVLFFRKGKLKRQGYGGAHFILPIFDEIIVLSTTVQTQEIHAEKVITSENQDVKISGFVVWRIEDPVKAYQSISGSQNKGVMTEINRTLTQLVESIIRTTVAKLTLNQVLRERSLILEAIMAELLPVVEPLGIIINTSEIRHVDVVDDSLFFNLQETYRQEARLTAEQTKIETEREIQKSQAESSQQVRVYQATQEEAARVRELEKDRNVIAEQQKVQVADKLKEGATIKQERENLIIASKLDKERLQVESETQLMQTELNAEAKKRKTILEEIQVQAEQRKLMSQAEAEALKIQAEAEQQAVHMRAQAEAERISIIAKANKESLLAEAEGRKAVLLAEAEGLLKKTKAQGYINEQMLMQELIKQLPAIAASMKVGDINWLNMAGQNGKSDESPLGIIPKNMLQVMSLAKSFGLDLDQLVRSIRGQPASKDTTDMVLQEDANLSVPLTNYDDEEEEIVAETS